MNETGSQKTNPVVIFGILVAAFVISLILGSVSSHPGMIAVIFAIAAFKAYLVLTYFIQLGVEPRYIKVLVGSIAVLLFVLYVGLVPDIQWTYASLRGR